MSEDKLIDHERIWLQHPADANQTEGRMWCQDKVWPESVEDHEPTEYVRADLCAAKDTALSEMRVELERVKRERDNYRFSPQGDNHHNALKCPYCNPGLVDFEARAATAEFELSVAKKVMEPFAKALDTLGRSRLVLDDRENIRGRGPDLVILMGNLRSAARALSSQADGDAK